MATGTKGVVWVVAVRSASFAGGPPGGERQAPWLLVVVGECRAEKCHGHPVLTIRSDN
jgi:hypothetical protein